MIPPYTTYITVYPTIYAVVSRFWTRLPDGTRVLTKEVTVYVAPEEAATLEEERVPTGRAQPPRREETVGVRV